MVNQIVNQISEFAYESVKSKKLNKRNTWYFCFYYRVCFFPILYKTTRKFPILGVGSCSQNAEKKPWAKFSLKIYQNVIDRYFFCLWMLKPQHIQRADSTGVFWFFLYILLVFVCFFFFFFFLFFFGGGGGGGGRLEMNNIILRCSCIKHVTVKALGYINSEVYCEHCLRRFYQENWGKRPLVKIGKN